MPALASRPLASPPTAIRDAGTQPAASGRRHGVAVSTDQPRRPSPPQVLVLVDDVEVLGVDAGPHPAEVVDLLPLWDGADVQLVADSMCEHLLVLPGHLPVAGADDRSLPQPAALGGTRADVTEKSFFQGSGPAFHE